MKPQSQTDSLEDMLTGVTCQLDPHMACQFRDYRTPNEGTPRNVANHLKLIKKGVGISTGTERSFYDLLLAPADKCEGLIIRDINPKVKGYCDFLILLLRVSRNREEFCELSDKDIDRDKLYSILRERITQDNSGMSTDRKQYYQQHLAHLADCYLPIGHMPTGGHIGLEEPFYLSDNEGIEYRKHDVLFDKLQRYAQAGNIVATVGKIDDLSFIQDTNLPISFVDVSNIPDYEILSFRGLNPKAGVRIIHTDALYEETKYYSGEYACTPQQEQEMARYTKLFEPPRCILNIIPKTHLQDTTDRLPIGLPSQTNLAHLQDYLATRILDKRYNLSKNDLLCSAAKQLIQTVRTEMALHNKRTAHHTAHADISVQALSLFWEKWDAASLPLRKGIAVWRQDVTERKARTRMLDIAQQHALSLSLRKGIAVWRQDVTERKARTRMLDIAQQHTANPDCSSESQPKEKTLQQRTTLRAACITYFITAGISVALPYLAPGILIALPLTTYIALALSVSIVCSVLIAALSKAISRNRDVAIPKITPTAANPLMIDPSRQLTPGQPPSPPKTSAYQSPSTSAKC